MLWYLGIIIKTCSKNKDGVVEFSIYKDLRKKMATNYISIFGVEKIRTNYFIHAFDEEILLVKNNVYI